MQKRLQARTRAVYIWLMAPLLGFAVFVGVFASFAAPVATAAASSNLNFQARLLTSTGSVVPDGNYNIEFKLYNADSTTGPTAGTCVGNASCLWVETRKNSNSQGVQVINGYYSVNLGSVTAFGGGINWDQQLWLTMNIGGTSVGASPTWDGEMQNAGHSIALTALPYAFTAGSLATGTGSSRGTLTFASLGQATAITLPDPGAGTATICYQSSTSCGFATGTSNSFIKNQTSAQTANFNIQSAASGSIGAVITGASGQSVDILDINANAVANPLFSIGSAGAATFRNSSDSTNGFQVLNQSGSTLVNANTTDGYVINNGTSAPGNVIENPSFESSGSGDGTGWYTPAAGQAITTDSTNAKSGNRELQITGNSATHLVYTKYLAVHPGDTIYSEAYVKNSAGATGDAGIILEFTDKDKSNTTFSTADTGLPGTSYIVRSITTTVPANKYFVRMGASVKSTATAGTFYFDDFYLKKANEQAPLLLTNVSATAFQVQNASSQTVLGVDTSTSKIFTTIPDSGTAIGFTLNTPSYTTAGAKLLSLQNNAAEKFSVDKDGNTVASGGASIGAGQTYKINGTQITSAALSNNSDLAKLSGTGPQIFSGDNKFTGTVLAANTSATGFQVQNASNAVFTVDTSGNKVILGTASNLTGKIQFQGSGGAGTLTLVGPTTPDTGNFTLTIPTITANANICTDNSICSGYESVSAATTSLAGKLNKNAADTSAAAVTAVQGDLYSFTNNSSGVASGVLKLDNGNNTDNALLITGSTDYASGKAYIVVNNTNGTPTGSLIDLQANAASEFSVDASGNVMAAGNISIASGKLYEINGVQITSAALSNDSSLAKLAANQTFSGNNTFSSASNSFTGDGAGLTNLNATNVASGTLNDSRLSSNVALLNRTGQTFTGDNTFAPTGANTGTTIKQTSSGSVTSGSVLDVQTANGTSHFLQITNAAANEGNVTLQSVGATRQLTLDSSNGTILLGSNTTTIQKQATSLTIDVANGSNSTLSITNSSTGVASLSIESGGTYQINSVQITSAALSNDSNLAKLSANQTFSGNNTFSSASNSFTGDGAGLTNLNATNIATGTLSDSRLSSNVPLKNAANTFTNTNAIATTSGTAFQVQTSGGSSTLLTANTSSMSLTVSGAAIYGTGTYSSGSTSTITQSVVDNNSTILASATAAGLTFTVPSPTTATGGRLLYVTNNGSNSFVISYGTGSFSLSVNSTVTFIWNGAAWTSAGADAGTLQTAYNNSTNSSTTPEIKVDSTRGGLDIQDADSTIGANLLNVRASATGALGQILFGVGNTGSVILQNSANSSTAFQIQNTIGSNAVRVDTTPINSLITNGNFEASDVSAWTAKNTAGAPSRDTTTSPYIGLASLTDIAGTASGNGIKFTTTSLTNATTYALSFSVRQISGTALTSSNFEIGWNNGTTDTACTGLNPALTAQAPVTTGWIRYSCTFTGSTSGHIYWKLSATVGSAVTFNLDAVQLEQASSSTGYKETGILLNGLIASPVSLQNQSNSTNAFQVQAAGGGNILVVDSLNKQLKIYDGAGGTNYALIYYDSGTSTANYTANTGTVAVGTGAGAITVTAGSGAAVNITANAASNWKTNTGTLTLQSGSGTSDFLVLNSGGSGQVQISGTSVVKLGSTTADPTCTNGALYYNTTTPQFRGCVNGTWQNLASITPTLQTTYNSSTGSTTPEVKLNTGGTDTAGFDIQDADTSIAGVLFAVRKTNAGGLGTSMFNVDTSNNSVNVGSSSGHATNPIILVLDNYSNSGADPTGVVGAMYYNGTNGKFRCYDGTWRDCMTGFNEITKTSDQAATQSNTTMQNDSALVFAMAASTNYVFDMWIPLDDSNATALAKYTFTVPAGATLNINTQSYTNATSNLICNIVSSAQVCTLTTSSATNFIEVRGYVRNSTTAGNLQFQFAQSVSTAASFPVVKAGAVLTWRTAN